MVNGLRDLAIRIIVCPQIGMLLSGINTFRVFTAVIL